MEAPPEARAWSVLSLSFTYPSDHERITKKPTQPIGQFNDRRNKKYRSHSLTSRGSLASVARRNGRSVP